MTLSTSTRRGLAGALLSLTLAAGSAEARPGDLDLTFGSGGLVTTDLGAAEGVFDVAVQADGRILGTGPVADDLVVTRYNPDGSLDSTFDGDGIAEIGFGADEDASSLAIQPDGKIVVAGGTNAGPNPENFALARLNADGSLDNGFSGDGRLFTDFGNNDAATAVAVAPDGSIVAAGFSSGGGTANFAVARYSAGGAPDNSFHGDGLQTIDFGGLDGAFGVAMQGDGRVVATGISLTAGDPDIALARLTGAGDLDATFSGDGALTTELLGDDEGSEVVVQPDGRLVVAGGTNPPVGPPDLAILRYDAGGALDPTFGAGGIAIRDLGLNETSMDLALQANGKIVALAGGYNVVRFDAGGSLDAGFGSGGVARPPLGEIGGAFSLALQPDGGIIAAGLTDAGPNPSNFGLVRVLGGEAVACRGRPATIEAAAGIPVTGTDAGDVIVGTSGRDRVDAGRGSDVVCVLGGKDRVKTRGGSDEIVGGGGGDRLTGAGGADELRGKRGNDRLKGGGGADLLVGGKGRSDRCAGGPGRDRERGC